MLLVVIAATLTLGTIDGLGAVPDSIYFQGILKSSGGNPVPDGSYSVTVRIYDAPSGGTQLWSETRSVSLPVACSPPSWAV
jgi:hypothetical protein